MFLHKVQKYASSYYEAFNAALHNPVAYWRNEAKLIHWQVVPKTTLRVDDLYFHKWFPDGQLNLTEQCLDVHLRDRGNQTAYFIESPITGEVKNYLS